MPSIGSVFRRITGTARRPPSEVELAAAAIACFPPSTAVDDAEYAALFSRLAALAVPGYRNRETQVLPVTAQERQLVAAELGALMAGVNQVVRRTYGLRVDPHLEINMHAQDVITIRVTA